MSGRLFLVVTEKVNHDTFVVIGSKESLAGRMVFLTRFNEY